eukprot:1437954-Rhodomonas_salina.1
MPRPTPSYAVSDSLLRARVRAIRHARDDALGLRLLVSGVGAEAGGKEPDGAPLELANHADAHDPPRLPRARHRRAGLQQGRAVSVLSFCVCVP